MNFTPFLLYLQHKSVESEV